MNRKTLMIVLILFIMSCICQAFADSEYDDYNMKKNFLEAITEGDVSKLSRLVEKNPDLVQNKINDGSMLHYAAESGHLKVVEFFIAKGLDLNEEGLYGATPLIRSLAGNIKSPEIAIVLINAGADVKKADRFKTTPLHYAALYANVTPPGKTLELVKLLIEKGADVNAGDKDMKTPLGMALDATGTDLKKKAKVIELLKKHGAK